MTRTRRWTHVGALTLILFALSCVTINVYFPAAEVEAAADRIVEEVYSGGAAEGTPHSSLLHAPPFCFGAMCLCACVPVCLWE